MFIDILLAVPFIVWLFMLASAFMFIIDWSILPRKAYASMFFATVVFAGIFALANPVAAPMHDTSRKNPVTFFEEPSQAEIVEPTEERAVLLDRQLKPRYDADTQDVRTKEMFDALDQAKETLGD